MIKRWILYAAVLITCTVFWSAHQSWMAWCLLCTVAWLPGFSLLLSLIPMLTTRPKFQLPTALPMGTESPAVLDIKSIFPQPPCRCRLKAVRTLTGEEITIRAEEKLPTNHCGELTISGSRFWVYDYLGLFRIPLTKPLQGSILIRPAEVAAKFPKNLEQRLTSSWQPKPGGGLAENHELRLYRPGDSLNQIHWKLTAKTGKLMIREAMIPRCSQILLTVDIFGDADQLDRKMGRLLHLARRLTEQSLPFQIRARTGDGIRTFPVTDERSLEEAMDELLCCPPLNTLPDPSVEGSNSWHFHIGGDPDEN